MDRLKWFVFALVIAGAAGTGAKELLLRQELSHLRPPARPLLAARLLAPPPLPVPPPPIDVKGFP